MYYDKMTKAQLIICVENRYNDLLAARRDASDLKNLNASLASENNDLKNQLTIVEDGASRLGNEIVQLIIVNSRLRDQINQANGRCP